MFYVHVFQKVRRQRVTVLKMKAARQKVVVLTVKVWQCRKVLCTNLTQTHASIVLATKVAGPAVWPSRVSRRAASGNRSKENAVSSDVLMPATRLSPHLRVRTYQCSVSSYLLIYNYA